MKNKKPENPNAFPFDIRDTRSGNICAQEQGLTMRDYFAAKAMQTLLNATDSERVLKEQNDLLLKDMTKASYKVSDAMLKEREK